MTAVLTVADIQTAQLNPALSPNGPGMAYLNPAYASLFYQAPDGTIQPDLATSWKYVGTGNKQFQFTIRSDAKFSDGTPVTAADVVASLKYAKAAKGGVDLLYMGPITTIESTGPNTVQLTLSSPDPILPELFSQTEPMGAVIAPAGLANPSKLTSQTFGAGPYMLDAAATVPNSSYTYAPNPYYYDKSAVKWKKIVVNLLTNPSSRLSALETGQVNAAYGDASTYAAAKAGGYGVVAAAADWMGVTFTDYASKDPLSNVTVRKALNESVDRAAITNALFPGGLGQPTDEVEAPNSPGYVPSLSNLYPYNPTEAKRLLAQAGYPSGFTFSVTVASPIPGATNMAQAIASSLAKVGVNMKLVEATATDFAQDVGKTQGFVLGIEANNFWSEAQEFFIPGAAGDFAKVEFPGVSQGFAQASTTADPTTGYVPLATAVLNAAMNLPVSLIDDIFYTGKDVTGAQATGAVPEPSILTLTPR